MKLLENPYDITHLTLRMLLHYLGKLKSQLFCKYSADVEKCKQIAFLSLLNLLLVHKFCYFRRLR